MEKEAAIALWRLSGNNEYRTIAHLVGVGRSTAFAVTNEVCRVIVRQLSGEYIRMPAGQMWGMASEILVDCLELKGHYMEHLFLRTVMSLLK